MVREAYAGMVPGSVEDVLVSLYVFSFSWSKSRASDSFWSDFRCGADGVLDEP